MICFFSFFSSSSSLELTGNSFRDGFGSENVFFGIIENVDVRNQLLCEHFFFPLHLHEWNLLRELDSDVGGLILLIGKLFAPRGEEKTA